MTELLFIRHALPLANVNDPGLSETGVHQSTCLALWLREEELDAIASSPLRRAVETAEVIRDTHGRPDLPLKILPELHELEERGTEADHYIPVEERPSIHPVVLALAEGRYEDVQPRHEWDYFRERGAATLERLLDAFTDGRVAVVAHGGIINSMLAGLLGIPGVFWFDPAYTGITRVESLPSGRVVLRSLNETSHLVGRRVARVETL
jgi:probable phosphoglycerate mutase